MRLPLPFLVVSGLSAALLAAVIGQPARAQSLGDLARQEAERRKTLKAPEKVITNKDVRRVPEPDPVPTPDTPDKPADPTASSADKPPAEPVPAATDSGVKDQKYWSERQAALQTALERDLVFAQALQSRINALTTDFTNRDDPAQRAVIAGDRQKALDEMARLMTAIEVDKRAIADFDEEARRAGVPPGWLR